jgi:hypothetical protein
VLHRDIDPRLTHGSRQRCRCCRGSTRCTNCNDNNRYQLISMWY